MHMTMASGASANRMPDLFHDIGLRPVSHGMNGIEPQTVESILFQPIQGVLDEERADRRALLTIEIDRCAPRRAVRGIEELRAVCVQVIAFGPKVVVNHIE